MRSIRLGMTSSIPTASGAGSPKSTSAAAGWNSIRDFSWKTTPCACIRCVWKAAMLPLTRIVTPEERILHGMECNVPSRRLSRRQPGHGLAIRRCPGNAAGQRARCMAGAASHRVGPFHRSWRCLGSGSFARTGDSGFNAQDNDRCGPYHLRHLSPLAAPSSKVWRNAGRLSRSFDLVSPHGLGAWSRVHVVAICDEVFSAGFRRDWRRSRRNMPRRCRRTGNTVVGGRRTGNTYVVVPCRNGVRGVDRISKARPRYAAYGLVQSRLALGWSVGGHRCSRRTQLGYPERQLRRLRSHGLAPRRPSPYYPTQIWPGRLGPPRPLLARHPLEHPRPRNASLVPPPKGPYLKSFTIITLELLSSACEYSK